MRPDRSRLPAVGPDPSLTLPAILKHALANGVRVRTVEHHGIPVVSLVLQVDGGSGGDPFGGEGLAAFAADMVDEGTGSLTAIDVADALARIGAEYDVSVGADATVFSLTTLARFADRGASLLARMVTAPSMREDDFARVRKLRLDRLRQQSDSPPAVAERAFLRLLYGSHPYGHPAIGTDAALRALSRDDVERFHARVFRPSRATIVAVGAMPHDELLRVVDDAFGSWEDQTDAGDAGAAAWETDASANGPGFAIVPRDGAAQSELRIGQLSARRTSPDYPALLLMNAVLGGQFVSRVNTKLREEKGFTYGARTGFDWRRGLAPFVLQTSVHTASTAEAIQDSLAELDAIRTTRPPTESELAFAKASLTRGYPRSFETAQHVAHYVAQLVLYDLPDTYFEQYVPQVNAVRGDDVSRVAAAYIDPARLTTLIVGDHAVLNGSLRGLGLGEPRVLPPDV